MNSIALHLGPLAADGYDIQRSGIRWLKDHGQYCRPGELVAYCNIGFGQTGALRNKPPPFNAEMPDLQVGFATKVGGRLWHASGSSHGGFFDYHVHYHHWRPEFVIGQIEPDTEALIAPVEDPQTLRLFIFAGRRTSPLAAVGTGLMSGWHNRSRVWSAESSVPCSTLLSLGICEQGGVIRGEQWAFLEFLEGICGPAQVVYMPENPLVPSACILLEQTKRSTTQSKEIAADLAQTWHRLGLALTPHDWLFVGSLLASLQESPLSEEYETLSRFGLGRTGPANAVLLSINSEASTILRHKRLGYSLNFHAYRINEAGPGVRAWLRTEFERVKRTPEMIQTDLRNLIRTMQKKTATEFLIMNSMSTSGYENVFTYSPFDEPMGEVLSTYKAKEMNLMLHDLARECDVSIVDTDAIAADMGGEAHLPDGVHQSGAFQTEIRQEIIHLLTARGVPGFSPANIR
jgi:hypothetical protein